MTGVYRMCDLPDSDRAAIRCTSMREAREWNTPERGFGIFMTVNDFGSQPRRREFLKQVLAWTVDMDTGTKAEQHARLMSSPLVPSSIIETKRGYQAWWYAKDGKPEHWNAIVLERLVPYFGADANARDLCRILRVPGFLHLKDPSAPFLIREIHKAKPAVQYTERQMAEAFRWVPDRKTTEAAADERRRVAARRQREAARAEAVAAGATVSESFWDAVYELDCEDGLTRLSGHWAVGGEAYTFKRTQRGNLNLVVNGKLTSCFVDDAKRIGSLDGGGPTLAAWLRWFKHDWKTVIAVLKEIYPHLVDVDKAQRKAA